MDFNISSFLEKFKNLTPPDDFLKTTFISAVKEETNADIKKSDIKIKNKTIYVSASPALKSELHIKKPLLLKRLRSAFEENSLSDIR